MIAMRPATGAAKQDKHRRISGRMLPARTKSTVRIATTRWARCSRTTPRHCTECGTVCIPTLGDHSYSPNYLTSEAGHWRTCVTDGCTKTSAVEPHDEDTVTGKCKVCEYVVTQKDPHTCSYTVQDKDATHHWMKCACGEMDASTKTEHNATDDHDCSTADVCACGHIVREAKDHVASADDGNCTTDVMCVNCDQIAKTANTGHTDADHDYLCDNAGCQITVGTPPEDKNDGIDLPIDTNN